MMKRVLSAAAARVTIIATIVAAVAWATSLAERSKKEIVGLTADEVRWFTPPYYIDGRQRAQLFGDSSLGGTWIDRVKIPGGAHVVDCIVGSEDTACQLRVTIHKRIKRLSNHALRQAG